MKYTTMMLRLVGVGNYSYNFVSKTWQRSWPLNAMARLCCDYPMARTYFSGQLKPSIKEVVHHA